MKKANFFILFVILTIILISFGVRAAEGVPVPPPVPAASTPSVPVFQRLSLEIKDLKLSKDSASYNTGDKIEGSFKLKNNTNFFSQGVYYEIAVHRQNLDPKTSPVFFLSEATVYDRIRITEPISFSPQEEKQINFSYQISKYFPAGSSYYLQAAVFSSREDILVNNFLKISIDNPAQAEKFILFDSQKSQVFGKDKMWFLQEGAVFEYGSEYQPAKLGTSTLPLLPEQSEKISLEQLPVPAELKPADVLENQVKVIIFGRVIGDEIQNPTLKIVSYRYGAPLKEVFNHSVQWESSFTKNSSSSFEIALPLFKDPGAYETFIQFFDGEEKVSNPLGVRYITAGDSGLVYDFLVEEKSAGKFVLNVLFTAPADIYVRDLSKDIPAQLIFTAKEEKTGKVCLSKTIDVNLKDSKPVQEPFVLENCSSPLAFEAQLKKDGNVLDEQKTTVQVFQPQAKKNYLAVIIVIAVLVLAGLGFLLFKKFKKDKLPPTVGLFIIIFIVSLIGIFGAHSAQADTGGAFACSSYCYQCDSGANSSWCYYGWSGYECPSQDTCCGETGYWITDPFSYYQTFSYCRYEGDWEGWTYVCSTCTGRNALISPYKWMWSNGLWSQFKFNDAYDSDASPNRFLYGYSTWYYGLWWYPLDYTISYPYDAAKGYFNVPVSESNFSFSATFHAAPNCGNGGGLGQGSMTAFILDSDGNVVNKLSTPPNWKITYQEGEASYLFNLSLSGLPKNKKYTLKIQDYKLFYGGQRTADYMNFAYVTADFCYGNCGAPIRTLILNKSGSGKGTVTSQDAKINCNPTCPNQSATYNPGDSVVLTASPEPDSTFAGWSGDCSGASCIVNMSQDRNVTVIFNLLSSNQPPSVNNLSATQMDYCIVTWPTTIFSWNFTDPDIGDTQSAYQVKIDNNSNFSSPEVDSGKVPCTPPCSFATLPGFLSWDTTYYWQLKVWDSKDLSSAWISGSSFTIPKHQYPTINFSWAPQSPSTNENTQFTDQSTVYGGATKSSWAWTFQDGNPVNSAQQNPLVKFLSIGTKSVTLKVTDSDGFSCQAQKTINSQLPLPDWIEIPPF